MKGPSVKERREQLVKRLFNSDYLPTGGYLCRGERYSPAGIACLLYQEHNNDLIIREENIYSDIKTFDGYNRSIPDKVARWFDMTKQLQMKFNTMSYNNIPADIIALELVEGFQIIEPTCLYRWFIE